MMQIIHLTNFYKLEILTEPDTTGALHETISVSGNTCFKMLAAAFCSLPGFDKLSWL